MIAMERSFPNMCPRFVFLSKKAKKYNTIYVTLWPEYFSHFLGGAKRGKALDHDDDKNQRNDNANSKMSTFLPTLEKWHLLSYIRIWLLRPDLNQL